MKKILNVSNHTLGLDQIQELAMMGYQVVELPEDLKKAWGQLTPDTYHGVCNKIKNYMAENHVDATHVAGFPAAVNYFVKNSIVFDNYYAYSERVAIEEVQPDGTVAKKSVFKHKGFYKYD